MKKTLLALLIGGAMSMNAMAEDCQLQAHLKVTDNTSEKEKVVLTAKQLIAHNTHFIFNYVDQYAHPEKCASNSTRTKCTYRKEELGTVLNGYFSYLDETHQQGLLKYKLKDAVLKNEREVKLDSGETIIVPNIKTFETKQNPIVHINEEIILKDVTTKRSYMISVNRICR